MDGQPQTPETILNRKIELSVQQIFTYGAFLITVGASVYTFFKAIPEIDKLDDSVTQLRVSNGKLEERIVWLQAKVDERTKPVKTP